MKIFKSAWHSLHPFEQDRILFCAGAVLVFAGMVALSIVGQ